MYLYSSDKTQVISVISDYNKNKRFVINGKYKSIPENGYIELDISEVPKIGDELGVCWNINGHKWEMVSDNSKIVKIKLDTTKYIFRENWFKDKDGAPTPTYYRQNNCFTVGVSNYSKHKPSDNGIVERVVW